MDFSLLEKHPYETGAIVLGGGFLLFLIMRRGGSSTPAASVGYANAGDPNAAAYNAQAMQAQAAIQGLNIQGATQISLAQIGADVSRFSTSAGVDVTDNQTAAQLALGLGTLGAQVETTRISAGIQAKYIDAIVAAFRGTAPASVTPGPISTSTGGYSPTSQITPAQSVSIPTPTYNTNAPGVGGTNPGTNPPGSSWFCLTGHNCDPVSGFDLTARLNGDTQPARITAPLAGGTLLAAYPNYETCDPRDTACVMRNQGASINWENLTITNNDANNRNRCLANAEMSRGFANYGALVSACG